MASGEKFPCIVCQSLTNSIYELHNHQKIFHTSEELSMSVIYLVNYMCLQQNMALRLKNVSNHLVWPGYVADYHNQKHYTETSENADQIQHFPELRTNVQKAIDYTPSPLRCQKNKTATSTKIKKKQLENHVASSSGLSQSKAQENDGTNTLSEVEEINDETFLQSVDGICRDLKSFAKAPDVGTKKRNCRPITTTGEKCHSKKTNKRKCHDQTSFYPSHSIPCCKNVGTVCEQNEGSKFQNDAMASCSSKNDKVPLKLASFAKTFQYLKQRKIESPNRMNGVNAHGTFQGSEDKTFPLHKGISILQEDLSTGDYEHKLKETVSTSDSNFSNDLSEQPDISETKKYAKKSDIDGKIEGI